MKKLQMILLASAALCVAQTHAGEVTEDFESVQVVDANGNVVSSNYTSGTGLDNGWLVVGGGICKASDYSNFGLWSTAYNGSKVSLTAQYGSSNSAVMVIPVPVNGNISFYGRKTSTSSSTKGTVDIYEMVEDNGSFKKKSTTSLKNWSLTTTWTQYSLDLGEDARYIGISMVRAAIDDVVYNTVEAADGPALQILQGTQALGKDAAVDLGLVLGSATSTFTLKNKGTGTLNATVACTGDYSASAASVSLGEGQTQDITVTQSEAYGSHSGALVVTAEGKDAVSIALSGIVRDPAKLYNDFSEELEGWTVQSNWTMADGNVAIGYASGTPRIITPMVKVTADDVLYIKYKKNTTSTYSSAYFRVWASEDGQTWTKVGADQGTDSSYDTWKATTVTGFPATAKYISITGQYIALDDFYGFAPFSGAAMSLTLPAGATRDESGLVVTDNFGFCKANATHTYTVTNAGNATLNLDIASSSADFTVAPATLEVAAGESATFDLTFLFSENYGSKSATVTLQPQQEEVDAMTINASAIAQDPETFEEDFENGIPETWSNDGWTVVSNPSYGTGTKMAYAGRMNDGNTLITPRLIAAAGEVIEMQALLPWDDETLTMEYSTDEGETWNVAFSETPAQNNTLCTLQWTAPADGIYLLKFSGRYNYIDNIRGFKYAPDAPTAVNDITVQRADNTIYDLMGRKVTNMQHGTIYIVNGHKVIAQ